MSEGGHTADDAQRPRPDAEAAPPAAPTPPTSWEAPPAGPVPADTAKQTRPIPADEPQTWSAPAEPTRLRLISGKVIPGTRYRLLRWLGEGGMGVVYEAEHVDIERKVALKILRYDLSRKPEMVKIFRDEARAASKTGHPNIVEIYDFGELPDGRFFLCMELLDGRDLVPATETTVIPPAETIPILRQLCKGLGAAHQAGVVHRDVKPENILVVRKNGRDGVVKIVDFGISAMIAAGRSPAKGDRIAGTPHYMAPEQIRGKPFDGRLDQYALGCVAYELLTGRTPFVGEGLDLVLTEHVDSPPPTFAAARPDLTLPAPLEQVVQRCLAKEPGDRYPTMADLEAALCEAQIAAGIRTAWDDLPLPDLPPDKLERLRARMPGPLPPARPRWVWPAVAAFSVLVGATAFVLTRAPEQPSEHNRSLIDDLAEQALLAASRTFYVAPPPGEPDAPTAYAKVLELEALDGTSRPLAQARAQELRRQLAAGLVALGDKYWDIAGARMFAAEYYIWARAFDPDNARAAERSGMTPLAFDRFQEKARSGAWSLGELQALGLVSALADDDDARRQERTLLAHADVAQLAISQHLDLDEGLRGAGIKIPPRTPPRVDPPPEPPPPEPPPPEPVVEPEPAVEPEPDKPKKPAIRSTRDPAKAKQLADEGAAALKAGRRADAENLFHQAIYYDNRNAKALMGLSDVYFDTGVKLKAVNFAELAVEAAPQSKTYHLKLGDAYFVVLRYRDALKHYEKARDLGEDAAQGRIDKVKKLIGP